MAHDKIICDGCTHVNELHQTPAPVIDLWNANQAAPRHASSIVANMPSVVDDGFEALLEPFYNGKKLTDPISTAQDKWQLLPAFLKVKGLF